MPPPSLPAVASVPSTSSSSSSSTGRTSSSRSATALAASSAAAALLTTLSLGCCLLLISVVHIPSAPDAADPTTADGGKFYPRDGDGHGERGGRDGVFGGGSQAAPGSSASVLASPLDTLPRRPAPPPVSLVAAAAETPMIAAARGGVEWNMNEEEERRIREKYLGEGGGDDDRRARADSKPSMSSIRKKEEEEKRERSRSRSRSRSRRKRSFDPESYLHWCKAVLGIRTSLTISEFEYVDHLALRWEENERGERLDDEGEYGGSFDWLEGVREGTARGGDDGDDADRVLPTVTVRGLTASLPVKPGDVVISVPLNALLSISTTVDHDPVLSRVMGPEARVRRGWQKDDDAIDASDDNGVLSDDNGVGGNDGARPREPFPFPPPSPLLDEYEVPLLAVALMYHRSLGRDSPLRRYVDVLLDADTSRLPFLWTEDELSRRAGEVGPAVRSLVRVIRRDIRDTYDQVMGALVREHPDVFAPRAAADVVVPPPSTHPLDGVVWEEEDEEAGARGDWMFSFRHFQWAFAMVNSRHHYLPVEGLDWAESTPPSRRRKARRDDYGAPAHPHHESQMQETLSTVSDMPPANQPTESWVEEARNQERGFDDDVQGEEGQRQREMDSEREEKPRRRRRDEEEDDEVDEDNVVFPPPSFPAPIRHSFLAPLADLINFGPPCLTGAYNAAEHAFELVAACHYNPGQEVTFWYSSECTDAVVANYGFAHPLVPPCPTLEEWMERSDAWEDRARAVEDELVGVKDEIDELLGKLAATRRGLDDCRDGGGGSGANIIGSTTGEETDAIVEKREQRVRGSANRRWQQKEDDLGL